MLKHCLILASTQCMICLLIVVHNFLWQCVLPGLRKRVKDPTCSDRLAVLLGTLSSFSLEW